VLALRTALVELSACVQVRQQIAANAVERFQNLYSLSSMLDRFDGMYQRLINEVDSRKSNATVAHE
jgi:hypothetical protein